MILFAGFAHPPSRGLVDHFVVVSKQHPSDLKGIGYVALPDEIGGADDGDATFPHVFGGRQLPQNVARFIEQVAADYVWSAEVDEIPVVDPICAPQVQVEKLLYSANIAAILSRHCSMPAFDRSCACSVV